MPHRRLMQYALIFPSSPIQSLYFQSTKNKQLRLAGVNNNAQINLGFTTLTNGYFIGKKKTPVWYQRLKRLSAREY